MQSNGGHQPAPDLSAILRTLAQSHSRAGNVPTTKSDLDAASVARTGSVTASESNEYDPAQFEPETKVLPKGSALKDPSTITTWAPALRYVMALIARDEGIVPHLQKLRRSQADHERQWWEGREALVQMQASRGDGRKRIEDILKGVGGSLASNIQEQTPEGDAIELKRYDAKVYRAFAQMHEAMILELKTMSIPFFCLKPSLIKGATIYDKNDHKDTSPDQSRISQEELKQLQLRMIETLEDLSGV